MKSWNDERYRIPGTNCFSLSKWSRENEPKLPPNYKVGDEVILTSETTIVQVYEDCDGTPLYQVDCNGYGISEQQLIALKEERW